MILQALSDGGINPFAAKLLVESFNKRRKATPGAVVAFALDGVKVTLCRQSADGEAEEGKYGVIVASKVNFQRGEPVFLLRATDALTCPTILFYHRLCKDEGCESEHTTAILDRVGIIEKWQVEHQDLVKLPDTLLDGQPSTAAAEKGGGS